MFYKPSDPPVSAPDSAGVTGSSIATLGFLHRCEDGNLGPHAFTASALIH